MFENRNLQLATVEASSTSTQPAVPVFKNIQAEADAMADEIIAELMAEAREEAAETCSISTEKTYNDISTPEQMQIEKVARLKRMIASGDYEVNALDIAQAMFDSGDLG